MRKVSIITFFLSFISFVGYSQISSSGNGFMVHSSPNGDGILVQNNFLINGVVKTQGGKESSSFVFGNEATWQQANDSSYIDGNVKTFNSKPFLFPTGGEGHYRPIGLSNPHLAKVSYFKVNPESLTSINTVDIHRVSKYEVWEVSGQKDTKITLTYDKNVHLAEFAHNHLEELTIIGWDGKVWSIIPSKVDSLSISTQSSVLKNSTITSDLNYGSITSLDEVSLSKYSEFTFGDLSVDTLTESQVFSLAHVKPKEFTHYHSIHFPFNDKNLTDYSKNLLNRLIRQFKQLENVHLKLVGHTDFYGDDAYNYALGLKRAETIQAYLKNRGITHVEIDIISEGEGKPKIECNGCHSRDMVLNRRVDIFIAE